MFPGGKGGRCLGLTTLPPSCANCLEIWEPQPPVTLRPVMGLLYHFTVQEKFDVRVTMHRGKFLTIKPTRCTNFSNLCLEWKSTYFGQLLCPSSGVFHCTHSNCICHTGLLRACEQDQDGTAVPSWSCSLDVSKPVWHKPLLCVQWKTPDDGQRNCPKHVEFHSKNKFNKLMHLVDFIWVRGSAVGWGTALQAGRSRVQFPMLSLEFFIDMIFSAALWPWSWLSL